MTRSLVLGFECTAHTFGASLVEGEPKKPFSAATRILSNANLKYPSKPEGFVPRKLADFHAKNYPEILVECLEQGGLRLTDLDAVAYSYGPGLGHSLHLGFVAAKTLSDSLHVPLVGVNHGLAHIEVGRFFCKMQNPLVLYVSGGSTQILSLEMQPKTKRKRYRTLGETLDIGLGNLLDLMGRKLQLEPPDAVGVLKTAEGGSLVDLPYSVKGMNVSFTGLLTAAYKLEGKVSPKDVCFSVQETAFSMACEALEKALVLTGKREVLLVGGNARNKRLQEMVSLASDEHGASFGVPPFEFCGDNGGMIALAGLMQFGAGYGFSREPDQKVRADQETITW